MKIEETGFAGLYLLTPTVYEDKRGYFTESYNQSIFSDAGFDIRFVQDNQSKSTKNVIRGFHYQNPPYAQTKLIRVLSGYVFEVVVDLRKESPTFGKKYSVELSEDDYKQLLIPKGFANGFQVLSEVAIVFYKCDTFYHPESEGGINALDPDLSIEWQGDPERWIRSEKDVNLPMFKEQDYKF